MKSFIVLALCVAAALAAPPSSDYKHAETLRYENTNIGVDGYDFLVETSDGTRRQEKAVLKNIGTENEALTVQGSYQYVGDDGQTYTVDFTADEFGFHPSGAHLPVAPVA